MRKKDFNAIASQIRLYHHNDTNPLTPKSDRTAKNIAFDFAFLLEQHDRKFNRQKFLAECGIEPYTLDGKVVKDNFGKGDIVYKT